MAEQSAPSVLGSVHVAPADETTEEGPAGAMGEAEGVKMLAAVVQGHTVMVDSTVTVLVAETTKLRREAGKMIDEKSILESMWGWALVGDEICIVQRKTIVTVNIMFKRVTGARCAQRRYAEQVFMFIKDERPFAYPYPPC